MARMLRAARLEPALYEEVEADTDATMQAATVVVISSVAAGIGTLNMAGTPGILLGTVGALIGWGLWAVLTYLIGAKLIPEPQTEADVGQLLRTTGFATAPGVLRAFMIVPGVGPLIALAASLWMLVAMIVAVRQALDYTSSARAVAVCLLGFVVNMLVMVPLLTPGVSQ
jgi:hypothetical protein